MLNICYASDDNYASYLGISLISLLEHNENDFDEINIFILNSNISNDNINKLNKIVEDFSKTNLFFIDVENIDEKLNVNLPKFKVNNELSLATYSRLFLPSLIAPNIDKILYLDCDTLILNSFKELWNIDISNYLGAGVLALNGTFFYKKEIGMSEEEPYINAGIILVNLKRWREENIESKFVDTIYKFTENKSQFGRDQGIVNAVLKDNMYILNPKFNLEGSLHNTSYDITVKLSDEIQKNYYDKKTLDDAINNPTIMHFCVGAGEPYNRPWLNQHHENSKLYRKYYEKTDFDENQVYHFQKIPLIKRFNRFLARNNITSNLIVKLVPDSFAKNIVKSASNNKKLAHDEDANRW